MSAHAPTLAPAAAPQTALSVNTAANTPSGSILDLLSGIKAAALDVAHAVEHTAHEEHEKHEAHEKAHAAAAAKAAAAAPAASGEAAKPAAGHGHAGHDKGEKAADLWNLVTRQIPNVYKEWKRGDLDAKEIGDVLDAAMDWAGVNWARPFVDPLSWGLKKLLGAHEHMHEIEPDYAHLGEQILGWSEDKDGSYHHSYEGFVKGMKERKDVNALNRQFRHFHDENLFKRAMKEDKASLRKTIATLLGLEGEVSLDEVDSYVRTITCRLGGHLGGTLGHYHIRPHHPLRPSLDPKHQAILKIYENALNWLTADALEKINSDAPEEKPFKIDFEHFGDFLLEEVNPKNRDRYLKGIDVETFEGTFKTKFLYLTHEDDLKVALKKPELREIVIEQLHQFTGVKRPMTQSTLADHVKVLLGRMGAKPTAVPPAVAPLLAEYEAFERALELVVTTLGNTNALTALFEGAEAQKPIDYNKIGEEVMARTKTPAALAAFEAQFDPGEMIIPYGVLLDERDLLAEAAANPDRLMSTLGKFYGLTGTLTNDRLARRAKELRARLTQLSSTDAPEAHQLANNIDAITQRVKDAEVLVQRTVIDYEKFGETILTIPAKKQNEQERYLNAFDETLFAAAFNALTPRFKENLLSTAAGREQLKAQTRALFKLGDPFDADDVQRQLQAMQVRLGGGAVAFPAYAKLSILLTEIAVEWTQERVSTLFAQVNPSSPESFVEHFRDLKDETQVAAMVRGYRSTAFRARFHRMLDAKDLQEAMKPGARKERAEAIEQVRTFVGKNTGVVRSAYLKQVVEEFEGQLATVDRGSLSNDDQKRYDAMAKDFDNIKTILTDDSLEALFADEPEVMDVKPANIGTLLKTKLTNKEAAIAFLRGYPPAYIRDQFNVLADATAFDTSHAGTDRKEVAHMQTMLRAFVGLEIGRITPDYLDATVETFTAALALAEPDSLPTDLKAKYDAFLKLAQDITANLRANDRLEKLFNPDAVTIDYDNFGVGVLRLEVPQTINFLRELNVGLLAGKLSKFKLELHLDNVNTPKERAELRTILAHFLGAPQDVVLTRNDIQGLVTQMLNKFGGTDQRFLQSLQRADQAAYNNLVALSDLLGKVSTNLSEERLANLYKGMRARKKTP